MADGNLIVRDDVVIVGAGPVGLTLAAELVRHGARVRILDRQLGPVGHSNALILHVRTLELFEAMGIVGRFLKPSFPVELVSLHTQSGRLGSIGLVGVDGAFPGPRIVSQAHVERVLIGHLEELGVMVERSTEATGFVQTETGVTVKTHGPSGEGIVAARWLVGCDGARSPVRDWAGIGSKGQRYEDLEFSHADCRVRWSYPSGRAYGFLGGKSAVALFPFDGQGHYRVLCARQKPADAQSAEPPTADEIRDALRAASNDPTAELTEIDWLSRWHSGHHLADRFQEGRVFLAGDAAHSHVPLGGQGMNIGIQDAVNLGWKLAAVATGQAKPKLLESYNPERRPIADEIVHMTDRGIRALTHPRDPRALAMRMFGSTVIALEGVQDRIRRLLGEVSFSYSTSTLSEDLGGSTGPIAGERVLDAVAVRASDRRTVRLYEMLERAPWTLMLFAGTTKEPIGPGVLPKLRQIRDSHPDRIRLLLITIDTALPGWPGECLIDREEYVHERYGARGPVVYLIRPDCYIGFRAPLARLDTIQAYLDRWLIPRA